MLKYNIKNDKKLKPQINIQNAPRSLCAVDNDFVFKRIISVGVVRAAKKIIIITSINSIRR
jgi:hypothetical protein